MAKLGLFLVKPGAQHESRPGGGAEDRVALGWRVSLTRQYELAGKSGARYRYTPLEEARFLPPAGANFVIAKMSKEGPTVVYAGETDNLANQTWREALDKAREAYGEAAILTRLNVTRAVREAERTDLIEQHQPPMNAGA
ncbi:MAG: hypothetical protein JWR47_1510 [Phenylobacterium sp.]|jgi:hypothetical protein|nr:hypothetical protein [Phenylobacterium sp.]MDB5435253.1 hypothetical protein [Phenylobacterium sp.]MDB5462977.1 hypothetical protein [Phenylobacterium sp.]MDB5499157.1 hypothetical protein [Phenylobacterium sp.]